MNNSIDKIQEEFDESPHYMAEEIAKLRADFKFIEECSGKEYALLQKSRAANARLRAALEFMVEATCTLHDHPEGQKRCREALTTTDGQKELEAVKYATTQLERSHMGFSTIEKREAIEKLREAFGLGHDG